MSTPRSGPDTLDRAAAGTARRRPLRCAFLVQGDGRGHQTQAIALAEKLAAAGHEVVQVFAARSRRRPLPDFFASAVGAAVRERAGLETITDRFDRRVSPLRTLTHNLARAPWYTLTGLAMLARLRALAPDLIVNFFDTLGGIALRLPGAPHRIVCVGHHYLMEHPAFRFPAPVAPGELAFLRTYASWSRPRRAWRMALAFGPPGVSGPKRARDAGSPGGHARAAKGGMHAPGSGAAHPDGAPEPPHRTPASRLRVTPPLLRSAVLHHAVSDGGHLLIYVLNAGYVRDVAAWHRTRRDVEVHLFRNAPGAQVVERLHRNLFLHRLDDSSFLELLAGCRAFATTGGFESVCEAASLGKPVLTVPAGNHVEQRWNAYEAVAHGLAIRSDSFDLDALLEHAASGAGPSAEARAWLRGDALVGYPGSGVGDVHVRCVEEAAEDAAR